jgi:hypothetical protein
VDSDVTTKTASTATNSRGRGATQTENNARRI